MNCNNELTKKIVNIETSGAIITATNGWIHICYTFLINFNFSIFSKSI